MKLLVQFGLTLIIFLAKSASSEDDESIKLYSSQDQVVELEDANLNDNIYNSDQLWILEFYAHWCGHCQRFVPKWKEVAEKLKPWQGAVRVAAINCATQSSCAKYGIQGTPTFHFFLPNSTEDKLGERVVADSQVDVDDFVFLVIKKLRELQSEGNHQKLLQAMPDITPITSLSSRAELESLLANNAPKDTLLVLELNEDFLAPKLSLNIASSVVATSSKNLVIRGVDRTQDLTVLKEFHKGQSFDSTTLLYFTKSDPSNPPVVFKPESSLGKEESVEAMIDFLNPILTMGEMFDAMHGVGPNTHVMDSNNEENNEDLDEDEDVEVFAEDTEYVSDLEQAVRYSLERELPNTPMLAPSQMRVFYHFLSAISDFIPVRKPIKHFVVSLREWPVISRLRMISSDQLKNKMEELEEVFEPFNNLTTKMKGCRGSEPHLRGYPCSLWVLFHTITVNAARAEEMGQMVNVEHVSGAIVGYIGHFFSCRHCAANFMTKANSIAKPKSNKEAALWLWRIHNKANQLLSGDPTEDPEHPKIIWPSAENCPECRASDIDAILEGDIRPTIVDGNLFYLDKVYDYLVKVYAKDNLVPNTFDEIKFKRGQRLRKLGENAKGNEEAVKEIKDFCKAFKSQNGQE